MPSDPVTVDVAKVVERVKCQLGDEWATWPGGWPGQAELAVIDAVFSVQARYGTETTGVRRCISRWRDHRGVGTSPLDDLRRLADLADRPDELARIFDNGSKLPGGTTKSHAVALAAQQLIDAGATSSADLTHDRSELRHAWCSVHGLGDVTWTYALMLLGVQGVKADTMIRRFVSDATGRDAGTKDAQRLIQAAAGKLGVDAIQLDHAIWQWQRRQS